AAPASQATSAPAAPTSAPVIPTTAVAPTTAPAATTAPAPAAPAAPVTFRVSQGASKATFRVREQLAGRQLPNDAVGTTSDVTGQLALRPDGGVVQEASKITVNLRTLATDNRMRDNYIKDNTLQVNHFPNAEFVPTKAEGLPSPLPASGEATFKLTGVMTVKGVEKEVTWDVTAKRNAGQLEGKATTAIKFGDFGMTPPRVASVLSITDEIRLELDLVATQA
ncbi:MAG TPA: YceI family protein, partial [Chloroflexota bacterium]|nr:YceI family protein [Chloroflexota bacterium]